MKMFFVLGQLYFDCGKHTEKYDFDLDSWSDEPDYPYPGQ